MVIHNVCVGSDGRLRLVNRAELPTRIEKDYDNPEVPQRINDTTSEAAKAVINAHAPLGSNDECDS
jgi:hypothetical protein